MSAELQRAQQLYQSGDLVGAEALLVRAVSIDPRNNQALELLSVICTRTRRLEEAIHYTQKLVELAPASIAYVDRLAALLENAGRYDEAIACSQHLIDQHPTHANSRYNFAALLKRAGQLEAALGQYSQALQLGISQQGIGRRFANVEHLHQVPVAVNSKQHQGYRVDQFWLHCDHEQTVGKNRHYRCHFRKPVDQW